MNALKSAGILPAVLAVVCLSSAVVDAASRIPASIGTPIVATGSNDEIFADGFDPYAQTITFTTQAPAAQVAGLAYDVAATSTSGLPVALSIDASAADVCALSGSTVSFQGAGTCVIDANQGGDSSYAPAPQAQQSFAVAPGDQTVAFTSMPSGSEAVGGAAYSVSATATSGLPVSLSIDASAASVCSITGTSVSFTAAGTCVIDANQAGNADWNAAPLAQQSFAVERGSQVITFTSTPSGSEAVDGATYSVSATAASGLPVSFSIDASATSVCSITGTSVSFASAGTCVIDANQAGNADWNAAPLAQQSFAVERGSQAITFTSTAPAAANVSGAAYAVAATASSGLPVVFSIDAAASGVCSVSGTSVTFQGGGTCVINADQPGDANWNAAPQAQQSFAVSACLTLSVGQVVLDTMPRGADFCVRNDNDTGGNAEFTYMPINVDTADVAGLTLVASNIVAVTGPPALAPSEPAAEAGDKAADASQAEAESESSASDRQFDASMLVQTNAAPSTQLAVGQLLDINTTIGGCNDALDVRKGRVEAITTPQSVGQQVLYAVQEVTYNSQTGNWDPAVPGGFATQDFQNIIDAFVTPAAPSPNQGTPTGSQTLPSLLKTGAMDTFTNNFGAPSDIDGNGGVIVFFTRKLNELVPPAGPAVLGSFQLHDMLSQSSCPASNQAEILYVLMPDPTGVVNSNVRTVSSVYGNAVPTLVHHFAHMDSAARRMYFNNAAPVEETWLDEALAWEAQELVFFNASQGLQPRQNIVVTMLTTGPVASIRVADFNTYQNPIYGSMRSYFFGLSSTNGGARMGPLRAQGLPVTAYDTHDGAWQSFAITSQFLRYALDRDGRGDEGLLHALVNSNATGMTNLQNVFGNNMLDWVRDFDVALYTDDAVAGVAQQYTIPSWNYRSIYAALGGFPLTLDPLVDGTPLSFALRYGGGTRYARFGVAPSQTATVVLTSGGIAPTSSIATALVRTK